MNERTSMNEAACLSALPASVRARLTSLFQVECHGAGSCIFREGEYIDRVFYIASGDVALEMDVPGRGRQRVLSLGPGDLLGWSPVFARSAMTTTAIALTDVALLAAPADDLRRRCETDHEIGYFFMRQVAKSLCQRLVGTRLQLLDLFRDDSVPDSEVPTWP